MPQKSNAVELVSVLGKITCVNSHTVAAQTFTHLFVVSSRQRSMIGRDVKNKNYDKINMDYSIHDAIEAGFNHVVFIIRKDIEKEFKEVIGDRIASICTLNITVRQSRQSGVARATCPD